MLVCGVGDEEVGFLNLNLVLASQLTTVGNLNALERLVTCTLLDFLGFLTNIEAVDSTSKDCVLLIEMRSVFVADEELRSVGVRSSIGHGKDALVRVRVPNLLVVEPITVDAHATSAISSRGVTSLHHEVINDPVEAVALVVILLSLLSCAECAEVLCRLGHSLVEKLKDNSALLVALFSFLTDCDVEVGLLVILVELRKLMEGLGLLDLFLVIVDTRSEEIGKTLFLLGGKGGLLLLDGLKLGTQVAILRCNLDCTLDVVHRISKLTNFHVGNTAQVKCLRCLCVDLERLRAVLNGVSVVTRIVRAH